VRRPLEPVAEGKRVDLPPLRSANSKAVVPASAKPSALAMMIRKKFAAVRMSDAMKQQAGQAMLAVGHADTLRTQRPAKGSRPVAKPAPPSTSSPSHSGEKRKSLGRCVYLFASCVFNVVNLGVRHCAGLGLCRFMKAFYNRSISLFMYPLRSARAYLPRRLFGFAQGPKGPSIAEFRPSSLAKKATLATILEMEEEGVKVPGLASRFWVVLQRLFSSRRRRSRDVSAWIPFM
jgi:hypothetical protein